MADIHLLFDALPRRMHFVHSTAFIRPLASAEANAIEARLLDIGGRYDLQGAAWVTVGLIQGDWQKLDELCALMEFGLATLTTAGHPLPRVAAHMSGVSCDRIRILNSPSVSSPSPAFPTRIRSAAASGWIRGCAAARDKVPDRMHITTSRFIRFAKGANVEEGLVDLCISLESLLDAQTEISFRFATCLTLASGLRGADAESAIELLGLLYDARSKIVHGDPAASKRLAKLRPRLNELRALSVRILTNYVLFLRDNTRKDWEIYLRRGFFLDD